MRSGQLQVRGGLSSWALSFFEDDMNSSQSGLHWEQQRSGFTTPQAAALVEIQAEVLFLLPVVVSWRV
jgi:hypothetical protein